MAKLSAFTDAACYEMSKMPDADLNAKRAALGKIWDAMDDRFGLLTHDNLFLHRTTRDILQASMLSFGWNLGDVRGLGGGIKDAFKPSQWEGLAKGEGLSRRTAFLASMMLGTGMYGALYQLFATGKGPDETKDYFFPRTGRNGPDGVAERVSLPTYMKDMASVVNRAGDGPLAIPRNLWHMGKAKISPVLGLMGELLDNEDWKRTAIDNPSDPASKQAKDDAMHVLRAFEPISVSQLRQQREKGAGLPEQLQGFFGVTPAPHRITHTDDQLREQEQKRKYELTPMQKKIRADKKEQIGLAGR